MQHEGPARVFDSEEEAIAANLWQADRPGRRGGHPLRGPQGRAWHARECSTPPPPSSAWAWGSSVALTHRRALQRRNPRRCHRPRLPRGGHGRSDRPWWRDGDRIAIDIPANKIELLVDEANPCPAQGRMGLPGAQGQDRLPGKIRQVGASCLRGRSPEVIQLPTPPPEEWTAGLSSRLAIGGTQRQLPHCQTTQQHPQTFVWGCCCVVVVWEKSDEKRVFFTAARTEYRIIFNKL